MDRKGRCRLRRQGQARLMTPRQPIDATDDTCAELPIRADLDEFMVALADLLLEDLVRSSRPR
jgi:hypothetical protein